MVVSVAQVVNHSGPFYKRMEKELRNNNKKIFACMASVLAMTVLVFEHCTRCCTCVSFTEKPLSQHEAVEHLLQLTTLHGSMYFPSLFNAPPQRIPSKNTSSKTHVIKRGK